MMAKIKQPLQIVTAEVVLFVTKFSWLCQRNRELLARGEVDKEKAP